jgi:hypothetical protein
LNFVFNVLKRLRFGQAVFWKTKCVASVKKIEPAAIKQASITVYCPDRRRGPVISTDGEVPIDGLKDKCIYALRWEPQRRKEREKENNNDRTRKGTTQHEA